MLFFFFQAEDGIRDHCVTGVQTCALPIFFPMSCSIEAIRIFLTSDSDSRRDLESRTATSDASRACFHVYASFRSIAWATIERLASCTSLWSLRSLKGW